MLAHHQVGGVEGCKLKSMTVRDSVGGAGFYTVTAENTAVVVDVVDLGVALGGGNPLLFGIFGCLNEDAVGGAGGGAQKAGHALFQAVFVALQHMLAAKTLLEDGSAERALPIGIIFNLGGLKDLPESDAHALGNGGDVAHDRHEASIR